MSKIDEDRLKLRFTANYPQNCFINTKGSDDEPTFGVDFSLMTFIAEQFNATRVIVRGDGNYCAPVNGSLNGLCGLLNSSKADFGFRLAPFYNRLEFVEFSHAYFDHPLTYMIGSQIATREYQFDIHETAYPRLSLFVGLLFLASVAISLTAKRPLRETNHDSIWGLFCSIIFQSLESYPIRVAFKTLIITWSMAGFLIAAIVSSDMISLLTGHPAEPLDTINKLLGNPEIRLYTLYTSYFESAKVRKKEISRLDLRFAFSRIN